MKYINIFILCALLAGCTMNELGESSKTVQKLAPDFYSMTVTGDAGFDLFLSQGGASSADELGVFLGDYLSAGPYGELKCQPRTGDIACSALRAMTADGAPLVGRNFDWNNCQAMVIRCLPANGYASVSTANLDFLGFGDDYKPEGMINRFKAVAGVYVPMDGINEKGLVVADLMAGDDEVTNQTCDTQPDLTTTTAIRLLLNRAADVQEALALLQQYNMHSDIGTAHHLFIADAAGHTVCVEWADNRMYVTETNVLNNHYLCSAKQGITSGEESNRHEAILLRWYDEHNGILTAAQMANALSEAQSLPNGTYGGTQWSIVYDLRTCSATYYWQRAFTKSYPFSVINLHK